MTGPLTVHPNWLRACLPDGVLPRRVGVTTFVTAPAQAVVTWGDGWVDVGRGATVGEAIDEALGRAGQEGS